MRKNRGKLKKRERRTLKIKGMFKSVDLLFLNH